MRNIFPNNVEIKGIGVSEGIVIGKSFIFSNAKVIVQRKKITDDQVKIEREKFLEAIEKTKIELEQIKIDLLKKEKLKEYANIISAHISMLSDKLIVNETIKQIEQGKVNAQWAFNIVIDKFIEHFEKIDDAYIRERKYDLEHLRDKVLKKLINIDFDEPEKIKSDVVLVAYDLSPADTAKLNTEKIKAIVTEMGSATSHTAIIAKAMGIPAVVAAETILKKVTGGDLLIVDGKEGKIIVNPEISVLNFYREKQKEELKRRENIIHYINLPSKTIDNVDIILKANIEIPEEVNLAKKFGCDGIGLYRTEFLFLNRKEPPSEEEHFSIYKKVAFEMFPKEVTIRTFDLGGDKIGYHSLKHIEKNPALGVRAIRFCMIEKQMFMDQICGILRANQKGNIRILFPLVSTLVEIKNLKELLREAKNKLRKKGIEFMENIKIGIMVEVPSAALIADQLAKEVDFFSIGTNDLIQYTMAIDRSNEYVAHYYDPSNVSVIRLLDFVLESAKKENIEVNICGEMAGEVRYIPLLLGMGFREFSMNPNSLPIVRKVVSNLNVSWLEERVSRIKECGFLHLDKLYKEVEKEYPNIFEY